MDFDIKPYDGAGCLKLRMERKDIRKCFNNQYKEFKKTPLSQSNKVVGTIAGEDSALIIARDVNTASEIAREMGEMLCRSQV